MDWKVKPVTVFVMRQAGAQNTVGGCSNSQFKNIVDLSFFHEKSIRYDVGAQFIALLRFVLHLSSIVTLYLYCVFLNLELLRWLRYTDSSKATGI